MRSSGTAAAIVPDVDGADPYAPIGIAAAILVVLGLLHWLGGWLFVEHLGSTTLKNIFIVRFFGWDILAERIAAARRSASLTNSTDGRIDESPLVGDSNASAMDTSDETRSAPTKPAAQRIRSIDTLRGCCLAIMIFVNYGGGGYWFFDHSAWNGLTVADLVFPIFVWTQGVSMAISFASMRRRGATQQSMLIKVVARSAKLYALGLWLNNGRYLSEWRILGVLQ